MHQKTLEFFAKRRSIRSYTGEPVTRDQIETVLRAAMSAPSANNLKPARFHVVSAKDRIRALCSRHLYASFGADAEVVILPYGLEAAKRSNEHFDQDMGAATENLLLATASLGLGATWCGMDDELQAPVREVLNMPADWHVFALIPIGVPAEPLTHDLSYDSARVSWDSPDT